MASSIFGMAAMASSCQQDEPNDSPFVDPQKPSESTVLIYAVATNNLSGNLVADKREMLEAASKIDLKNNNVLIFQTVYEYDQEENRYTGNGDISLIKLVDTDDKESPYGWKEIKKFSTEISPLNPERISEVISYVTANFSAKNYGLVFWSHSTASQPFGLSTKSSETLQPPMLYSFGQDKTTTDSRYEQINIDELALAIPDHLFHYIWFDSCYMSNIESIYQLRNKCKYYVGYPTEVLDNGLPYHLVLQDMVGQNPDLLKAADTFFQYYDGTFATIAVTDMSLIEEFADFCSEYYTIGMMVDADLLKKYSRSPTGPFYDLGEYTIYMAQQNGGELTKGELDQTLDKWILYKNTTKGNYYDIKLNLDPERFSGISTHLYSFKDPSLYNNTDEYLKEEYYKSLDWFQRVFIDPQNNN